MPFTDLTAPPAPPSRSMSNDEFIAAADAFVAWWVQFGGTDLPTFITELETAAALIAAAPAYADPGLVAMTGQSPEANTFIYFNGASSSELAILTAYARSFIAAVDGTAARTVLGLGALAQLNSINDGNWSGTDLAVANGGTGASSASAARTNLGLAPLVVPTGAIMPFAMNAAPSGWLDCDGAAVSRTTYADLFTAISTTFGVGDGSTTFNVPDLRGEFVRGWDDGRGVDSGRAFGSTQADEFEAHTHTSGASYTGTGPIEGYDVSAPDSNNYNITVTGSTGGTETRPRNIALLYGIKT
jgi:microcystin-dependent protein